MPSTDVRRCRFVEHQPSAINICSWMPLSAESADIRDIAVVVRDEKSGKMELWNGSNQTWELLGNFSPTGLLGKSVEGVCWTLAPGKNEVGRLTSVARLFTVGLDGIVMEWDLERMIPRRHVDSNGGGAIWCCAASPSYEQLVFGCEDGSVRVCSLLSDNGRQVLKYERSLGIQQGGRVMSITWSPCGKYISTGSSQGQVSIFDVKTGRIIHVMKLEPILVHEQKQGVHVKKEAIVWFLLFIGADQLASSDSAGRVSIWSVETGTLVQSLNISDADLFTMATSGVGLFASGADQKVYALKCDDQKKKWYVSGSTRTHVNDVRSLSIGRKGLLSGSVDTTMTLFEIGDKLKEKTRVYTYTQKPIVKMIDSLMWAVVEKQKIKVWDMSAPCEVAPRLLLSLQLPEAIVDFDISTSNSTLALLSGSSLKVYRCIFDNNESGQVVDVSMEEVKIDIEIRNIRSLCFESDNILLLGVAVSKSNAKLIRINVDSPSEVKDIDIPVKSVKQVTSHGYILSMRNELVFIEGKMKPQVIKNVSIERLEVVGSHTLAITGSTFNLLVNGVLQEWPKTISAELSLLKMKDRILGCSKFGDKILAYGSSFLLSVPLEASSAHSTPKAKRVSSRKKLVAGVEEEPEPTPKLDQIKHLAGYTGLLFASGLPDSTMVVVERPWKDITAGFPPVVKRKLFGGFN